MVRKQFGSRSWLITVLLVGLILAACSSPFGSSSDDLSDTEWELVTLRGTAALADVSVSMNLAENDELFGSSGCNRFTGTWETGDDNALTLEAGGMTMMACEGPISDQETSFLSAMADTASFQLDDDDLTLLGVAGNEVATLTRLDPADLTGTQWEVTAYNNGQQGVVGVLPDTEMTAVFSDDEDSVSGNAGCNTYGADFSTGEDNAITIENPITTFIACDQPIMDQETQYLAALVQAASYDLGARTLELRAADGSLLASYRIAE